MREKTDIERRTHAKNKISLDDSIQDKELLRELIKKQLKLSDREIDDYLAQRKSIQIPISVFSNKLSTLESISLYLKDYRNISLTRISKILERSVKTIWAAQTRATRQKIRLDVSDESVLIPANIFADRTHSLLETLVHHLHVAEGLRFSDIATRLNLDPATVWTANTRYNKKDE